MTHAKSSELSTTTQELVDKGYQHYVPVYSPCKMILSHGQGARLWDLDGQEYIDLGTGISVNNLGHQHEDVVRAMLDQGKKLWHTSNIYFTEPAVRLAEELAKVSFADRVFFANSGAEANEAAIKLARKYSSLQYPEDKREIITFYGSFHGRTLTTVTATAQPKYHEGFEPLPPGFIYCPFNDFDAVEKAFSSKTCAVLIEPIQGEGGVHIANPEFLAHLRTLCQKHEALLIFDEIQCGMGRSGKLFAYQWKEDCQPDIMTLAKALGNGLPIGAMLTTDKIAQAFSLGNHGSTFGGNPVATAVARVVLSKINSDELMNHVLKQGDRLCQHLNRIHQKLDIFQEIRGQGLMIGAELQGKWVDKAREIREACRLHGVLILQAGPNVLRFLPPLNISTKDLDAGMELVEKALQSFRETL